MQNFIREKTSSLYGAPLEAARQTVQKQELAGRGHIEYMNEKYKERRVAHGRAFPQEEAIQIKRMLCAEFLGLPRREQRRYEEIAQNRALAATDVDLPPEPEAVHDYDRNAGNVLWGISDLHNAINPAEASAVLLREWLGTDAIGGFNQYQKRLRKRLVDALFIKDDGSIPPGSKNNTKKTCWMAHPGLCRERDAAFIEASLGVRLRPTRRPCERKQNWKGKTKCIFKPGGINKFVWFEIVFSPFPRAHCIVT